MPRSYPTFFHQPLPSITRPPQLPNFTSSLRPHAEGKLADRFQSHFDRYTGAGGNNVHYIAFDFHKECGTKRYHRMSVLWDQVRSVT